MDAQWPDLEDVALLGDIRCLAVHEASRKGFDAAVSSYTAYLAARADISSGDAAVREAAVIALCRMLDVPHVPDADPTVDQVELAAPELTGTEIRERRKARELAEDRERVDREAAETKRRRDLAESRFSEWPDRDADLHRNRILVFADRLRRWGDEPQGTPVPDWPAEWGVM